MHPSEVADKAGGSCHTPPAHARRGVAFILPAGQLGFDPEQHKLSFRQFRPADALKRNAVDACACAG
jgi:hypothetical protein